VFARGGRNIEVEGSQAFGALRVPPMRILRRRNWAMSGCVQRTPSPVPLRRE
jgi:hypothetical protein